MLRDTFLIELFGLTLNDPPTFDLCARTLDIRHLPSVAYKTLWASIKAHTTKGQAPTRGVLEQENSKEEEVLALINKIYAISRWDKGGLYSALGEYLSYQKAALFSDDFYDLFQKGNKTDAIKLMVATANELSSYSLFNEADFSKLFTGINPRMEARKNPTEKLIKIPFSIDPLDDLTGGGMDIGDTALFLARSGVGKTKLLRWIGMNAAMNGFDVLHIQAEGSKEECVTGYDATWLRAPYFNALNGSVDKEIIEAKIKESQKNSGEVYIHAFETFDEGNLEDVYDFILQFKATHGSTPQLLVVDYFEMLNPDRSWTNNPKFERDRRITLSKKLKNIALQFKMAVVTATQASTLPMEAHKDPNFVMTRDNIAESKTIINPFSFFFTLNQTKDEYAEQVVRIHCDKLRNYKRGEEFKIATDYRNERFFDREETARRWSAGTPF